MDKRKDYTDNTKISKPYTLDFGHMCVIDLYVYVNDVTLQSDVLVFNNVHTSYEKFKCLISTVLGTIICI